VSVKLKERVSAARDGTWSLDLANETLSLLLTMALCVGATVALIKGWQVERPGPRLRLYELGR